MELVRAWKEECPALAFGECGKEPETCLTLIMLPAELPERNGESSLSFPGSDGDV